MTWMQKHVSRSSEEKKWAEDLVAHMVTMSPTSMKVTLRQLREGRKLSSLKECLQMEYRSVSCEKGNKIMSIIKFKEKT